MQLLGVIAPGQGRGLHRAAQTLCYAKWRYGGDGAWFTPQVDGER